MHTIDLTRHDPVNVTTWAGCVETDKLAERQKLAAGTSNKTSGVPQLI